MLDVDVQGIFVNGLFVLVLGEKLLDGVVEELVVALGVLEARVGQVLVVWCQVVEIDVNGDLLAVGNVSL